LTDLPPNQAYYRACAGRWACRLGGDVRDFSALRGAVGLINALSLVTLSRWPPFLGTPVLKTSVAFEDSGDVVHTTAVTWLGVPLVRSREVITLDQDGTRLRMSGQSRFLVAPWRVECVEGVGEIDASTTRATYQLQLMGTQMLQTTERSDDAVTLTQTMPGYAAVQPLERV